MHGLPFVTEPQEKFHLPKCFEFVGNDVCPKGNHPAQSKHQLLEIWPIPEIVRGVETFIGFAQFYSKYIHHFELRVTPLWELTIKHEYTNSVAAIWTDACQRSFDDIQDAIISDPCLLCYNPKCLVILCSDFSSKGFGYVICQPGTDDTSEAAMKAYQLGSDFNFMMKGSSATIHPVAFGER